MNKVLKQISYLPLLLLIICVQVNAQGTNGGIATNPYPGAPVYNNGTLGGGNEQGVLDGPGVPGDGAGGDGTGNTDIPLDSGVSILISIGIAFAFHHSLKDHRKKQEEINLLASE